jgi:putative CocE/NonD family hydrolase
MPISRFTWFAIVMFTTSFGSFAQTDITPGNTIRIEFNVRVPMRDKVTLSADVYRPAKEGRFPVILTRTPYNKNGAGPLRAGRYFASHDYVYVAMDDRGRGDSDGVFRPFRDEGADGYDAIEWCSRQPWSSGKVGTIGASYVGYNQWLAAVQQPPHLTTMIVMVTMTDPFADMNISSPGGQPSPTTASWYHYIAGHVLQNMNAVDWGQLNWHLPLYTMDETAGRPNQYWKDLVAHSKLDEWWEPFRYQNKYARVRVPVFHISGWYDDALLATPMNFAGMRKQGATEEIRNSQKMLIGPWPHAINSTSHIGSVDFGPTAIIDLEGTQLQWFDYWLKGIANGVVSEPRARLFLMGKNEWTTASDWPPPGTEPTKYYLHSAGKANTVSGDGTLSTSAPAREPADHYVYDPANPAPFLTEPSFAQLGGPDDYRPVEQRSDVLVFTSEEIKTETSVCGPLRAEVYAASSATDTDFTAMLIDVWQNGFAQRLNDGLARARFREGMDKPSLIEPGKIYRYQINMWNTCQAFLPGHRIRVEIASSAFPKFDRNLNTGEELGRTTRMISAQQTLYHDAEHPSFVELAVFKSTAGSNR